MRCIFVRDPPRESEATPNPHLKPAKSVVRVGSHGGVEAELNREVGHTDLIREKLGRVLLAVLPAIPFVCREEV